MSITVRILKALLALQGSGYSRGERRLRWHLGRWGGLRTQGRGHQGGHVRPALCAFRLSACLHECTGTRRSLALRVLVCFLFAFNQVPVLKNERKLFQMAPLKHYARSPALYNL